MRQRTKRRTERGLHWIRDKREMLRIQMFLLKLKTKGRCRWLTFAHGCAWPWWGKEKTPCLVSAVTSSEPVVEGEKNVRKKNAHTLLLSVTSSRWDRLPLLLPPTTTFSIKPCWNIFCFPPLLCVVFIVVSLRFGVSQCVAIRSLSVFLTRRVEKIEWLIKEATFIFFGSWMHQSALMSDSRNHPSGSQLITCKCNFHICITKDKTDWY